MNKNEYYDQFNYYVENVPANQSANYAPPTPPPCPPPSNEVCDENTYVIGNNVNFSVNDHDSEIKADIVVGYRESIRVWGQVRDCFGKVVPCAYVKLLKITPNGLVGVAHTMTDCQGFYQFDICQCKDGHNFTIVVGKAATGSERVVSSGLVGTSCNIPGPSNPCNVDPCNCDKNIKG